jgi:serine/threonine protein kinase
LDNAPTVDRLDSSLPDSPHRFRPGLVLAERYRVLRFLAQGGMGEIYEVEDLQLAERVALKTVRAVTAARHPTALERFKREIQLARRVTHPNVCRIFEYGSHTPPGGARIVFLTMELLSGETLLEKLQRELTLTPGQALPLVAQMVAALEAAHRVGVIHRDFKSANVVLVPMPRGSVRAVVTDFGLAQLAAGEGQSPSSTEGVSGTLDYMAPEQIRGGEPTPAVDVYALGVVMYEMLTGKRPFDDTHGEITRRLTEPVPSPRALLPELDPAWERLVVGCLERDPARRFRDATEVARALPGRPAGPRGRQALRAAAIATAIALAAVVAYRAPLPASRCRPRRLRGGAPSLSCPSRTSRARPTSTGSRPRCPRCSPASWPPARSCARSREKTWRACASSSSCPPRTRWPATLWPGSTPTSAPISSCPGRTWRRTVPRCASTCGFKTRAPARRWRRSWKRERAGSSRVSSPARDGISGRDWASAS